MSEKIYACLLRLFPSAFRRLYGEEAIQLLRDRLRDEVGFLPRSRLILNLTTDIFMALPQAYSNSYAETALLTPHFEGGPTFQALPTEPMRPVAIAFASILTLVALAIVSFLMSRTTPYLAARNQPRSPIESVIERLNQTTSSDSGAGAARDVPEPTSAESGQSAVRPLSKANAVLSSETIVVSKPLQSDEQNVSANDPDSVPAPSVATSSSLAGVPPRQGWLTERGNSSGAQARTHAAAFTDLSGVWAGKPPAVSGEVKLPQWFVLKESRTNLTGTGGPASTEQYPIAQGSAADGSVRFELNDGSRTLLYDLRLEDKGLQGTLSIKRPGQLRAVKVSLGRVQ